MYDKIQHINDIMCLPTSCWSDDQRELVEEYFSKHGSPFTYPGDDDVTCDHPEFETRYLFTSTYRACKVCGLEEDEI